MLKKNSKMKPSIILLSVCILLFSCKENTTKNSGRLNFNPQNIQKRLKEYDKFLNGKTFNINDYRNLLDTIDKNDPVSIPLAVKFIKIGLKTDVNQHDYVLAKLEELFYKITSNFEQFITYEKVGIYNLIQEKYDKPTLEIKSFLKSLNLCGINLYWDTGEFYLDQASSYFFKNFKGYGSKAYDVFLLNRKQELTEQFSNDAAMLISWQELWRRVKSWEDFITKYPNFIHFDICKVKYNEYLSTLLTGLDNTPVFDYNYDDNQDSSQVNKLSQEVKSLYEKIIEENESRNSTVVISKYYEYLKSNNFIINDETYKFIEKMNLTPMNGTEPTN